VVRLALLKHGAVGASGERLRPGRWKVDERMRVVQAWRRAVHPVNGVQARVVDGGADAIPAGAWARQVQDVGSV